MKRKYRIVQLNHNCFRIQERGWGFWRDLKADYFSTEFRDWIKIPLPTFYTLKEAEEEFEKRRAEMFEPKVVKEF